MSHHNGKHTPTLSIDSRHPSASHWRWRSGPLRTGSRRLIQQGSYLSWSHSASVGADVRGREASRQRSESRPNDEPRDFQLSSQRLRWPRPGSSSQLSTIGGGWHWSRGRQFIQFIKRMQPNLSNANTRQHYKPDDWPQRQTGAAHLCSAVRLSCAPASATAIGQVVSRKTASGRAP